MIDIEIGVTGFKELDMKLQTLALNIQKNIMVRAVRAAANVVRDDARQKAPRRTTDWEGDSKPYKPGNLKKNIISYKPRQKKGSSLITFQVGPGKKAWYGRLVESGHRMYIGKKNTGRMVPPYPYLRPAFDENINKAIDTMRRVMAEGIERGR